MPPEIDAFAQRIEEVTGADWADDAARFVAREMELDGSHDTGHLLRVVRNAVEMAEGERQSGRAVDGEVVSAAALTHDLVNLPKDHPEADRASTRSADRAVDYFRDFDRFDDDRLATIYEAVERHSYSRGLEAESLEAQIVTDADRLDALGAVGIARCFHVSGSLDRQICHPLDPFADERARDDAEYGLDHFYEKLLRLADEFYTETGAAMARERDAHLREFLEQFRSEVTGAIPADGSADGESGSLVED